MFSLLALIIQFLNQVNSLIGPGVLLKILAGRYHKPQEVERFFLFLDVTSSTAIAEKIGPVKFLSLLNDFFFDLSDAVVVSRGKIYKYVGDEAIVVWDRKKGTENANPLFCFFTLKDRIKERSEYYVSTYGLLPEFKAGLHYGKVVMGEMGRHRKEIAYLGDTVNATARIEGECGRLKEGFLASREALDLFKIPATISSRSIGMVSLRGRDAPVELAAISASNADNPAKGPGSHVPE